MPDDRILPHVEARHEPEQRSSVLHRSKRLGHIRSVPLHDHGSRIHTLREVDPDERIAPGYHVIPG
jgi:hypothetical protein